MPRETIDRRLIMLLMLFGGLLAALTARLFYLQIIQNQHLSALALHQQERTLEVPPARGAIYDCKGRPLALSVPSQSFFAVPSEIRQPVQTARKIAGLVGGAPAVWEQRLRSGKGFVWIKRKTTEAAAAAFQALSLEGVHALTESKRVYPEGSLASHILGFVGLDNQGLAGIELQYEHVIRGQNGWVRVTQDAKGRRIAGRTRVYKQSAAGQDVYLTIDKVVQHVAERELERGIAAAHARAGSVVVMDPRDGRILALANKPDYDPNYFNHSSAAARRNRAIHDVYEPGSTFKLVTAAGALEEHCFRENEVIDCEHGQADFNGLTVRDHEPRGRLTLRDVIVYSSNIGAVKIGLRLGVERMAHYAQVFGFGRPTGLELPGEANGLVKPFHQWRRWNLISIPFGQGLAVTPLQIATAYAAVANDGLLPRPWIVKSMRNPDGSTALEGAPSMRERVVSPETARVLRDILTDVVTRGSGEEAGLPNYHVAGKTGTAQKAASGGYDPHCHVASFVGFLPADRPQMLVAVVIDEPEGVQWGGFIAGPIFREISRELVAYLGISPQTAPGSTAVAGAKPTTSPVVEVQVSSVVPVLCVPNVLGKELTEGQTIMKAAGLETVCLGQGKLIQNQLPAAGKMLNPGSRVVLYLASPTTASPATAVSRQVVVPNLAGMSLRNAIQILNAYGLGVRVSGSGMVAQQAPGPNALARIGQICSLHCQDPEGYR